MRIVAGQFRFMHQRRSTVSRPRMGSSHRVREKPPARRPRVVVEKPAQSRPAPAAASGARWGRLAYRDPSSRPP